MADRTFTFINSCSYTVWPAITNYGSSQYSGPRGWEAVAGSNVTQTVPHTANLRVWGRRGCNFDSSGAGSCAAGDCGGGLVCSDASSGNANLIELNLNADGLDYWDVSYVPGFTLPVAVSAAGCASLSCPADLTPTCPDEKMMLKNNNGQIVGCLSACMANLDGNPGDSNNCCSGSFNARADCPQSGVEYYSFFKAGCNNAYAFPYDDNPGNPQVIYTCPSDAGPAYTIEFCPGGPAGTNAIVSSSSSSSSSKSSTSAAAVTTTSSDAATTTTSSVVSSTTSASTSGNPYGQYTRHSVARSGTDSKRSSSSAKRSDDCSKPSTHDGRRKR